MTAIPSDPGYDLSRLYGGTVQPFRFKRSTVVAIGVAAAFHAAVGYYVVKSQFTSTLPPYEEGDVIKLLPADIKPPPPPPPPSTIDRPTPQTSTIRNVDNTVPVTEEVPPLITPRSEETVIATGPVTTFDPSPTPVAPTPSLPKADPIIRNPTWLKKPTADQVSSLYPTRAVESGVAGGATLLCEVMDSGAVNNCAVIDESPKGYRFGNAALAMSKYFRLNPRTVDGAAQTGAKVRIPIVFNLG